MAIKIHLLIRIQSSVQMCVLYEKVLTPDRQSLLQESDEISAHLSFKTNSLEAFTAYVEILSETCEVTPEETTFTNEVNPDIKVIFSAGLVDVYRGA